jgi:hypothetical protein
VLEKAFSFRLQPSAYSQHREFYMSSVNCTILRRHLRACTIAFISLSAPVALCQAAPVTTNTQAAQPIPKSSDILSTPLSQVSQAIAGLNISRWKAPGEVRSAAQQNADSIQRDLHGTLPGLLAQADAAPESVSAVFPVYRNIDALYDVLLRISQTADLAASPSETSSLDSALSQLEGARKNLGNAISSAASKNEAEVVKLRATVAQNAAAAQQAAPAKTTVVNDGPAKSTPAKRKKKPAPTTTTPAPAPAPQPPQ